MVVAAGLLKIPADVEMKTLYNATYSGPVMPWIDRLRKLKLENSDPGWCSDRI